MLKKITPFVLLTALAVLVQSSARSGQKETAGGDAEIRATLEKLYATTPRPWLISVSLGRKRSARVNLMGVRKLIP